MATYTLLGEETGAGGTDLSGKTRRVLRYLVDVPSHAVDTNDPAFPRAWPFQQPSPPVLPLVFDSVDILTLPESPTTHSLARVFFSNDRAFRFSNRADRSNPFFKTWELSWKDVEIEIPVVERWPLKIPNDGTPAAEFDWKIKATTHPEIRAVFSRHVVLQNFDFATGGALIEKQQNKIHVIEGQPLLFKASDIVQTESNIWECDYSWMRDRGTPISYLSVDVLGNGITTIFSTLLGVPREIAIGPSSTQHSLFIPSGVISPLNQLLVNMTTDPLSYVRAPFHRVEAVIEANGFPRFYQFLPHAIEENGWQSLPGLP